MKMSGDRIAALYHLYDGLWGNYTPDNAHELLLYGHITELKDKLEKMVARDQAKYTLSFNGTEALAFLQLWDKKDIRLAPIQALMIQSVFDKLYQLSVGFSTYTQFRRIKNAKP